MSDEMCVVVKPKCIGMAIKLAVAKAEIKQDEHKCDEHGNKSKCSDVKNDRKSFAKKAQRLRDECPGFGEHF